MYICIEEEPIVTDSDNATSFMLLVNIGCYFSGPTCLHKCVDLLLLYNVHTRTHTHTPYIVLHCLMLYIYIYSIYMSLHFPNDIFNSIDRYSCGQKSKVLGGQPDINE